MKQARLILVVGVALVLLGLMIGVVRAAGDVVTPATLSLRHLRGEATKSASSTNFHYNSNILLTNCVLYNAATTNGSVQGLSNVTVTVAVGNTDAATVWTCTVQSVSEGLYWCSITTPVSGSCYIEATVTDENTNTYTYGWKTVSLSSRLAD